MFYKYSEDDYFSFLLLEETRSSESPEEVATLRVGVGDRHWAHSLSLEVVEELIAKLQEIVDSKENEDE